MPRRSILVVSYYYPPDKSVGANRWAAMVPYLRDAGHDVAVLTTNAAGGLADDHEEVIRTTDLQASASLRRLLRRAPLTPDAGKGGFVTGSVSTPPKVLNQGLVPDAHLLTWLPGAVRAARRIVRERSVDCIITSAPPDSVALLPLFLGSERPAWIADFRDGWRYEPLRGQWPSQLQDRVDRSMERRTISTAEVVVGATRPIADDFRTRLGAFSAHVPNGWDPRLDDDVAVAPVNALDPNYFNIVHTGQLSGPRGRDPEPLFEAIRKVAKSRPDGAKRLRIVLVGGLDQKEQSLLNELEIGHFVDPVGQRPRAEAVALQRASDALLLMTSIGHRSQATGKIYEYLAADRPILLLADQNEAARIVSETKTGTVVDPNDVGGIAAAIDDLLNGQMKFAPSSRGEYLYPAPAHKFERLVETAVARR